MGDAALNINTGGGTSVEGNASAGHDFIGRDQINIYNQRQLYLNVLSDKKAVVILNDCGSDADAKKLHSCEDYRGTHSNRCNIFDDQ